MNITGLKENPGDVCKHPANDSSAKQQWSFSKAQRFPDHRNYTATLSY